MTHVIISRAFGPVIRTHRPWTWRLCSLPRIGLVLLLFYLALEILLMNKHSQTAARVTIPREQSRCE